MNEHNYSEYNHTSVKVHHEPGGGSQWSIGGWGNDTSSKQTPQKRQQYPPPQQVQYDQFQPSQQYQPQQYQSQQSYSSQAPQQQPGYGGQIYHQGSSMSSRNLSNSPGRSPQHQMRSEHNIGADGGNRTSVKVHHAPGGGSSLNIFGGGTAWDDRHERRLSPKIGQNYHVGQQYQVQSQLQRSDPHQRSGGGLHDQFNQNQQSHGGLSNSPSASRAYSPTYRRDQPHSREYPPPKVSNQQWQQPVQKQYPPPKQQSYPSAIDRQVPEFEQRQYSPAQRYYQQQQQQPQQQQIQYAPPKQPYGNMHQKPLSQSGSQVQVTFGQRIDSGNHSGPTTGTSSIKLHNPPGGKSQIQLF